MKKLILRNLSILVVIVFSFLLLFNYLLQLNDAVITQTESALSTIYQIEEILATNEDDLETLTESLQEEYVIKAKAVSYILEHIDIETVEEYQDLANLLDIDEIHVFTEEGEIYEGSVEAYFGYTFYSGEQMMFFLPMLEDKTLSLCQDVTPNTAEEKPMMYVATWKSDGSDIVQIGIAPERILEEQSKNEIAYIFSTMPTGDGSTLFAVDVETGIIQGCSEENFTGLDSTEIGLTLDETNTDGEYFYNDVDGITDLCVFLEYNGAYIGVTYNKSILLDTVSSNILTLSIFLLIFILIVLLLIFKIIDHSVLKNIDLLVLKVSKIAGGDLDTTFDIGTTPEFIKLNAHLNMMVANLINNTAKMSHVLDLVETKIAVYEYKKDMKRVFATSKIDELLGMNKNELAKSIEDKALFEKKINSIKCNKTDFEDVYRCGDHKYLQIEDSVTNDGEYGIILDVTDNINERKLIEHERDYDILTELFNRRAFLRSMDKLFEEKNMGETVVIALDLDNLKMINDNYGHDTGDLAIKTAADIIKNFPIENKITSRMGGDEYALVIYGEKDRETLIQYVKTLEQNFHDTTITNNQGETIDIEMSAGYIFCNNNTIKYQSLLKYADIALYEAKKSGKNLFIQYKN